MLLHFSIVRCSVPVSNRQPRRWFTDSFILIAPTSTRSNYRAFPGQDNSSVITDSLFSGDINQCDFFTIQADSPAAKLGFVNITKPSMRISGCNMDGGSILCSSVLSSVIISVCYYYFTEVL